MPTAIASYSFYSLSFFDFLEFFFLFLDNNFSFVLSLCTSIRKYHHLLDLRLLYHQCRPYFKVRHHYFWRLCQFSFYLFPSHFIIYMSVNITFICFQLYMQIFCYFLSPFYLFHVSSKSICPAIIIFT